MQKTYLIAGATAGLIAVALGAFGAHGLTKLITEDKLRIWEKGVQYQIYHAIALVVCAMYMGKETSSVINNAALCFLLGIICFSGSLYLLATRDLLNLPRGLVTIIGPITPLGGLFFIAGWGLILYYAIRK